jgi:hypothetical protein
MTSPPFWIASLTGRRASTHRVRASAARSAPGRPAKKTSGPAPAATPGTRSTPEGFSPPVSTVGLRPNASRAPDGRRIRIGTRNNLDFYERALSEAHYKATRFMTMLHEHRGLETARLLIHSSTVSEGYTALWERKRLDLTVEAVVHDNPKWHPLFTRELDICVKRLTV